MSSRPGSGPGSVHDQWGSFSSRIEVNRADHTTRSTAIKWRTTSLGPHLRGGCGRPRAARAGTASRAGKSANDWTSAARLVTGRCQSLTRASRPEPCCSLSDPWASPAESCGTRLADAPDETFSRCEPAPRPRITSLIVAVSPLPACRPCKPRMSRQSSTNHDRADISVVLRYTVNLPGRDDRPDPASPAIRRQHAEHLARRRHAGKGDRL